MLPTNSFSLVTANDKRIWDIICTTADYLGWAYLPPEIYRARVESAWQSLAGKTHLPDRLLLDALEAAMQHARETIGVYLPTVINLEG